MALRALTSVLAALTFGMAEAAPAEAGGGWRNCESLIVANGRVQIVPSLTALTGMKRGEISRDAVALFIQVRHDRCATARALVSVVVGGPDESTALASRGFRVRSVRGLGSLPRLGPAYRLLASRGRTLVRYVRLGRLGFGGGLGGRARAGPWPRAGAGCRRFEVIGVRGSGEGYAGPFGMADTVGATAAALVGALPRKSVRTTSLRYPAASVSELAYNNGEGFYLSMKAGQAALVRRVEQIVTHCARSRIALIGYSQGAAVVSEGLRRLIEDDFDERTRGAIRAVILYADPYSAGANSTYDMTFTPAGAPTTARLGHGALGSRTFALGTKLYRVRDVCFAGDLVCDLPDGTFSQLLAALLSPVHSNYKNCCHGFPLTRLLGRRAARLMERR